MTTKDMVKRFQCPGCVCGMDPDDCAAFKPDESYGGACRGHVLGTTIMGVGKFALGLPKGFCRSGLIYDPRDGKPAYPNKMEIRLHSAGARPRWDDFNVPVWALMEDGFLFVRTYNPRVNRTFVDVVEGGTLEMVPRAIDVGPLVGEMD